MDESLASMTEIELSELEKEWRALYAQIVGTNALIQSIFFVTMIPWNALKTSCIAAASAIALQQDLSMLVMWWVGYFVACWPRSWFNYRFISKFGSALPNSSYVAKASAAPWIWPVVPWAAMAPLAAKNKLEEPVKKLMEKYLSYLPTGKRSFLEKDNENLKNKLTLQSSLIDREIRRHENLLRSEETVEEDMFLWEKEPSMSKKIDNALSNLFEWRKNSEIYLIRDHNEQLCEIAILSYGKLIVSFQKKDILEKKIKEQQQWKERQRKTIFPDKQKKRAARWLANEMLYQNRMKKQAIRLCEEIVQILSPIG